MRYRRLSFEQLVNQNKQEIMDDENSINQLELRLERKHAMNLQKEMEDGTEFISNER